MINRFALWGGGIVAASIFMFLGFQISQAATDSKDVFFVLLEPEEAFPEIVENRIETAPIEKKRDRDAGHTAAVYGGKVLLNCGVSAFQVTYPHHTSIEYQFLISQVTDDELECVIFAVVEQDISFRIEKSIS